MADSMHVGIRLCVSVSLAGWLILCVPTGAAGAAAPGPGARETPRPAPKPTTKPRNVRRTAPAKFEPDTFERSAFQFRGPRDYDPAKDYPLLVYLHGGGSNGTDNQKALKATPGSVKGDELQKRHPTFVYVPQCPPGGSWASRAARTMVVNTVQHLKAVYPIDPRRVYLAGFSMGGSGSYHIAKHYHDVTRSSFAAVVRCAGQSDYPMATHKVLARSSVWIQIGKLDNANRRYELALDSYAKLREIHYPAPGEADTHETAKDLTIVTPRKTYKGRTRTLTEKGVKVARISEYDGEGHSTWDFPFRNPQVFAWMFAQRLAD